MPRSKAGAREQRCVIAFTTSRDGNDEVYVMAADRTHGGAGARPMR